MMIVLDHALLSILFQYNKDQRGLLRVRGHPRMLLPPFAHLPKVDPSLVGNTLLGQFHDSKAF